MTVIAIFNNKGGVGKTTSAQNISAALALFADQRILVIDLDQQANLTMGFGVKPEYIRNNVADFVLGKASLNDVKIKYNDTAIDILPASSELRKQVSEIRTKDYPNNLSKALFKVKDLYDYVIIDCPPAISVFSDIALVACDQYYIPLQAEYFSYEGLRNLAEYIEELKRDPLVKKNVTDLRLTLGGVFAVGFNPNTKRNLNKVIVQSVEEQLGDKVLNAYIRTSVALSEAQAKGMHIFDYERNHKRGKKAAQDYHKLAAEIFKKTQL